MTYELAKKLKDAGFSVPRVGCRECDEGRERLDHGYETIYSPFLSELIVACGVDFGGLAHNPNGWRAWSDQKTGRMAPVSFDAQGKSIGWSPEYIASDGMATPEEAVANLWLELNKK